VADVTGTRIVGGNLLGLGNPLRGLLLVLDPLAVIAQSGAWASQPMNYVLTMLALAGALSTFTMLRLRVWNPSDQRSQPTKTGRDH